MRLIIKLTIQLTLCCFLSILYGDDSKVFFEYNFPIFFKNNEYINIQSEKFFLYSRDKIDEIISFKHKYRDKFINENIYGNKPGVHPFHCYPIKNISQLNLEKFNEKFSKQYLLEKYLNDNKSTAKKIELPRILKYQPICPEHLPLTKQDQIQEIFDSEKSTKSKMLVRTGTAKKEISELSNIEIACISQRVKDLYNKNIIFSLGVKNLLEELNYLGSNWQEIKMLYEKPISQDFSIEATLSAKYTRNSVLSEQRKNKKLSLTLGIKSSLLEHENFFLTGTSSLGVKYIDKIDIEDPQIGISFNSKKDFFPKKFLQKSFYQLHVGYIFDNNSNGYISIGNTYVWDFSNQTKFLAQQFLRYPLSGIKYAMQKNYGEYDALKFLLKHKFISFSVEHKSSNLPFSFLVGVKFLEFLPKISVWNNKYRDVVLSSNKLHKGNILFHSWNKDLFKVTNVSIALCLSYSF